MTNFNGKMFKSLKFVLTILSSFYILAFKPDMANANENNESVQEFRYCLRKSVHPNLRECVGRTAISFLQRFEGADNFTFVDNLIFARDDTAASRSLVNFLDTDPVDFRGIFENAGAVVSQRALEFHMDGIYPGLMFKIGPSADSNSVAEFMIDPKMHDRNFKHEEPSTARILTKQYILPFLLALKINLVALVPILFAVISLLLKKALFISKLVIFASSILGVGGIANSLGVFSKWYNHADLPHPYGGQIADGLSVYPGKNTIYSQYEQDEFAHTSPYKRQNRKVIFEHTRKHKEDFIRDSNKNARTSTTLEPTLINPVPDHFYDYEKQFMMQDRSGKLRQINTQFDTAKKSAPVTSHQRFQTSDNSGWKALNL